MRIQTNTSANQAYRNLSATGMNLSKSIEKLSSGFRINRSSDDAAGLAISNALRSEGRALSAAQRNAAQGASVLDIADGTVNQITSLVDRARELAMQAASANTGADNSTAKTALDDEFQEILSEIDRQVSETTYQGSQLLDGNYNGSFRIGTESGSATISVDLDTALDAAGLGFDTSATLATASGAAAVLTAINGSGGAQSVLAGAIGKIGAAQNRFEAAINTLTVRQANVAAAESVVRDLDIAAETTKFTKFQVLQQAGTAMLAQANQTSQGVLSLLRG